MVGNVWEQLENGQPCPEYMYEDQFVNVCNERKKIKVIPRISKIIFKINVVSANIGDLCK